jgi:hypothetical protein
MPYWQLLLLESYFFKITALPLLLIIIMHLRSKRPMTKGLLDMVFEVELELTIDEEDGSIVVQKMSELANKAKELGFTIVEAEVEREEEEEGEEETDG